MSLYNMVMGYNPFAPMVLNVLGIAPEEITSGVVPRFRDAYVNDAGKLVIFTRTGGGNRSDYAVENAALAARPGYAGDHDDSFDETFAHFEFDPPENQREHVTQILSAQGHFDPMKRFQEMVEALGQGGGSPRAKKATEQYVEKIKEAITGDHTGDVIVIDGDMQPTHPGTGRGDN